MLKQRDNGISNTKPESGWLWDSVSFPAVTRCRNINPSDSGFLFTYRGAVTKAYPARERTKTGEKTVNDLYKRTNGTNRGQAHL